MSLLAIVASYLSYKIIMSLRDDIKHLKKLIKELKQSKTEENESN